jgi:hypothetical protein
MGAILEYCLSFVDAEVWGSDFVEKEFEMRGRTQTSKMMKALLVLKGSENGVSAEICQSVVHV